VTGRPGGGWAASPSAPSRRRTAALLAADLPSWTVLYGLEWAGQAWREGPETHERAGGWGTIAADSARFEAVLFPTENPGVGSSTFKPLFLSG
jgi:hypothetical protein